MFWYGSLCIKWDIHIRFAVDPISTNFLRVSQSSESLAETIRKASTTDIRSRAKWAGQSSTTDDLWRPKECGFIWDEGDDVLGPSESAEHLTITTLSIDLKSGSDLF